MRLHQEFPFICGRDGSCWRETEMAIFADFLLLPPPMRFQRVFLNTLASEQFFRGQEASVEIAFPFLQWEHRLSKVLPAGTLDPSHSMCFFTSAWHRGFELSTMCIFHEAAFATHSCLHSESEEETNSLLKL